MSESKFDLKQFIMTLLSMSSIALTQSLPAQAQVSPNDLDQGDFVSGNAGAPPNLDSEYVAGLAMQMPTYGGNGCPQGTLQAVLSPDQRSISVLFNQYIARAGGNSGVPRMAMNCQVNIPFSVPIGYRVQVVKMDYRGFTSVPQGARSTFAAGFRFLEINGMPINNKRVLRAKVFIGPDQENFQITSLTTGPHWSPCGLPFVLAAESYINAQSNRQNDEVMTTVDSLDAVQVPVVYSLRWKRCSDNDSNIHPQPPAPAPGPRPPWPSPGPRPRPPMPPPRPGWH
jgi:hypothetical protein